MPNQVTVEVVEGRRVRLVAAGRGRWRAAPPGCPGPPPGRGRRRPGWRRGCRARAGSALCRPRPLPRSAAARTTASSASRVIGSAPTVGSSSSRTRGRWIIAVAACRRRCWPPDRSRTRRSSTSPSARASASWSIRRRASRRRRPYRPAKANRFSRAVAVGYRASSWGASPRIGRTRAAARDAFIPSTRTAPASGVTSPAVTRAKVDLPAPLCPTSPAISPDSTARSKPSSATVPPNRFTKPVASSSAVI